MNAVTTTVPENWDTSRSYIFFSASMTREMEQTPIVIGIVRQEPNPASLSQPGRTRNYARMRQANLKNVKVYAAAQRYYYTVPL